MPRFSPFVALRYSDPVIDRLLAPPYDVLDDDEVAALKAQHPHNITHVDIPQESEGADRYTAAAARLQQWIDEGVLISDAQPSFTIYRMRFVDTAGADRDIVGVLGGLEVVDEGAGGVLAHERTTPKASTDRLDLTRATKCNLSPVWGLSLARGLTEVLHEPAESITSVVVDGVEHVVERVTDPARLAAISARVGADEVLIADGHHRYGVARSYRDHRRSTSGDAGAAAETLTFVSELAADQLSVGAIHRLYHGVDTAQLITALDRCFERVPAGEPGPGTLAAMDEQGVLCLVLPDGSATWLRPRPDTLFGVRSLDGVWLEHALAGVDHAVSYQHDAGAVVHTVVERRASAGILIRPVSVAEIERTAREGLLMPPKSTFFTPKLRTGFVLRSLG